MRILVLRPGIESTLPALETWSLNLGPQGKSQFCYIMIYFLTRAIVQSHRWIIYYCLLLLWSLSHWSDSLRLPWTVAHQVPLSLGFPRQEYWSRLPFSPGNPLTQGLNPCLLHWQADSLLLGCSGSHSTASVQFRRSADPMDCGTPDFRVHRQLVEFTQTHVRCVGDAIQPSHLLSCSFPPAFNLSQYQGLFQ